MFIIQGQLGENKQDKTLYKHLISVWYAAIKSFLNLNSWKYSIHYHAYALSLPPTSSSHKYLINHTNLPSYCPYRLIKHVFLPTHASLQYTVLKSNIYIQFIISVLQRMPGNEHAFFSLLFYHRCRNQGDLSPPLFTTTHPMIMVII